MVLPLFFSPCLSGSHFSTNPCPAIHFFYDLNFFPTYSCVSFYMVLPLFFLTLSVCEPLFHCALSRHPEFSSLFALIHGSLKSRAVNPGILVGYGSGHSNRLGKAQFFLVTRSKISFKKRTFFAATLTDLGILVVY